MKAISFYLFAVLLLGACGGGGSSSNASDGTGASTDTRVPVLRGVVAAYSAPSSITLTATGSDDVAVTGYCFTTNSSVPTAADSCFEASATKVIVPVLPRLPYYAWAKDAAGNISVAVQIDACTSAGAAALSGISACDSVAPTVSSIAAVFSAPSSIVLTASASDNVAIAGYCFKTNSNVPVATDACFQVSNQFSVMPTLPRLPHYVWAKDAASNVSAALQVDACSSAGSAAAVITACDATAPVMTGLSTTYAAATGVITLTATSTDNAGGSGGMQYCFKTSNIAPLPANACFQVSNKMSVVPPVPLPSYYVWAKDAAGNVSTLALSGPCSQAGFASSAASTLPTVCMMTNMGEMVFELESAKAPITVNNFLQYVRSGFYTNTVFHRVRPTFMVQGGGFNYTAATNQLTVKAPTYSAIALETPATTGLSNAVVGSIAMARTATLNSATSQFFVNVVDNTALNTSGGGYAVFGKLISGTSTLTTLKSVPIVSNGTELSLPTTPPVIEWALQLK